MFKRKTVEKGVRMKKVIFLLLFTSLITPILCKAADYYLGGNISNITSAPVGLLIMLDSGVPGNCVGTPFNWMVIREQNKTMVSVALTLWTTGNKGAVVYTSGLDQATGYCIVSQLDPIH